MIPFSTSSIHVSLVYRFWGAFSVFAHCPSFCLSFLLHCSKFALFVHKPLFKLHLLQHTPGPCFIYNWQVFLHKRRAKHYFELIALVAVLCRRRRHFSTNYDDQSFLINNFQVQILLCKSSPALSKTLLLNNAFKKK